MASSSSRPPKRTPAGTWSRPSAGGSALGRIDGQLNGRAGTCEWIRPSRGRQGGSGRPAGGSGGSASGVGVVFAPPTRGSDTIWTLRGGRGGDSTGANGGRGGD